MHSRQTAIQKNIYTRHSSAEINPCGIFSCSEESEFYSTALEQLVLNRFPLNDMTSRIVEFGSGTGEPVISALTRSNYLGIIHGYEINPNAAKKAQLLIEEFGLTRQYNVYNQSFFDAEVITDATYLVANPPYLPAYDKKSLILPDLFGGEDGLSVTKDLLSMGYPNVMLLVSSYSNPSELLRYASTLGYRITDFQMTKMPFGFYSKQHIVQKRIHDMKEEGKAFFTNNYYLLGSVLFKKTANEDTDLSAAFHAHITATPNHLS